MCTSLLLIPGLSSHSCSIFFNIIFTNFIKDDIKISHTVLNKDNIKISHKVLNKDNIKISHKVYKQ